MVLMSSGFSVKGLATLGAGVGGTGAVFITWVATSGVVGTGTTGVATAAVGVATSGERLVAGVTDGAIVGEATNGVVRTEGEISATRSGLIGSGVGAATG